MKSRKAISAVAALVLAGCTETVLSDYLPKSPARDDVFESVSIEDRVVEIGELNGNGFSHIANGVDIGKGYAVVPLHVLDSIMGKNGGKGNEAGSSKQESGAPSDYASSISSKVVAYADGRNYGLNPDFGFCTAGGDLALIKTMSQGNFHADFSLGRPSNGDSVSMISRYKGVIMELPGRVIGKLDEGAFENYTVKGVIVTDLAEKKGFSGSLLTNPEKSRIYGIGVYGKPGNVLTEIKVLDISNIAGLLNKCTPRYEPSQPAKAS